MRRQLRSIVLDDKDAGTADTPAAEFRLHTERDLKHSHLVSERWRDGNTLHIKTTQCREEVTHHGTVEIESSTTTKRPCFVDWVDLWNACEVERDEDMQAPWIEHDGWDHERDSFTDWCHRRHVDYTRKSSSNFQACRGYAHNDGETFRVHIDDSRFANENRAGFWQHMMINGASKQVAAEMTALWERRYIDQLVKWYIDGFEWWWVKCEYEIDGEIYEASLSGIDDYDHADTTVREELAFDVACQLEKMGYVIKMQPPPRKWEYDCRKVRQQAQNWTD
jgi:hypothetical protein